MRRILYPVFLVTLLGWAIPVGAQTPLLIIVDGPAKKAKSKMPAVFMQNLVLQDLMKKGAPHWEFMDGGKDMGELMKQIGETDVDAAQVPGRMSMPDLQVRLGPVTCKDGVCTVTAHLVEPASGRKVGMSLGRGKSAKAAVADLGGKLRKAVQAFDGKRQKLGGGSSIRLENSPAGVQARVRRALLRSCAKVKPQMISPKSVSFRVRCKLDSMEMQKLLSEAAGGEEFEFVQHGRQLTIMQFK